MVACWPETNIAFYIQNLDNGREQHQTLQKEIYLVKLVLIHLVGGLYLKYVNIINFVLPKKSDDDSSAQEEECEYQHASIDGPETSE